MPTLPSSAPRPRTLVVASASGFYGDRGDEVLTEDSAAGSGFLAEVCVDWEAATEAARDNPDVRVSIVRIGIVQSTQGGALKAQLPIFKLGLGGRLGSGDQFIPWIGIDDLVGIFVLALTDDDAPAVMNAAAPAPVRQADYAATLARVLGRPAKIPVPAFGPKLVLGDMADEMLLASTRVLPEAATTHGYTFHQPTLDEALRTLLGRHAA